MSIDRLITCNACGHTVDDHEGGGCRTIVRAAGVAPAHCGCPLARGEAIDRIVDAERVAIHDRWRAYDTTTNA